MTFLIAFAEWELAEANAIASQRKFTKGELEGRSSAQCFAEVCTLWGEAFDKLGVAMKEMDATRSHPRR